MHRMDYEIFAKELVIEAGEMLHATYTGVQQVMQKGDDPRNDITAADRAVNGFLMQRIKASFPAHGIYSEEGVDANATSEYVWALDPIDGTSNFARAIPHFAVCVSLLQNRKPIVGVFYNPVTKELFSFSSEHGARLGAEEVHTSVNIDPMTATALLHVGRNTDLHDWGISVMGSFLAQVKKTKDFSSSSLDLAFLAAGRVDVVVYGTLTTEDIAGAIGMVRAAGGEVYALATGEPVQISKQPQTIIATANDGLYENLKPLLHADLLPRN